MDLILPDMNGLSSTKKIIGEGPKAKVIVISTINKKDMVINALKSKAKGYILKPVEEDKLLKEIERILSL